MVTRHLSIIVYSFFCGGIGALGRKKIVTGNYVDSAACHILFRVQLFLMRWKCGGRR